MAALCSQSWAFICSIRLVLAHVCLSCTAVVTLGDHREAVKPRSAQMYPLKTGLCTRLQTFYCVCCTLSRWLTLSVPLGFGGTKSAAQEIEKERNKHTNLFNPNYVIDYINTSAVTFLVGFLFQSASGLILSHLYLLKHTLTPVLTQNHLYLKLCLILSGSGLFFFFLNWGIIISFSFLTVPGILISCYLHDVCCDIVY